MAFRSSSGPPTTPQGRGENETDTAHALARQHRNTIKSGQRKARQRVREVAAREERLEVRRTSAARPACAVQWVLIAASTRTSQIGHRYPVHKQPVSSAGRAQAPGIMEQAVLAVRQPEHIWVLACFEGDAGTLLENRAHLHNQLAIMLLQKAMWEAQEPSDEHMDLIFEHLKRMEVLLEEHIESTSPTTDGSTGGGGGERTSTRELLATAYGNLAAYYFRREKLRAALDYCSKASAVERKLHGQPEFSTHLRTAAVLSDLGRHVDALRHCELAWSTLLHQARGARVDVSAAPDDDDHDDGEKLPPEYQAAIAVACNNLAVEFFRLRRPQEALALAQEAEERAAQALPADHPYDLHIRHTGRYARLFASYVDGVERSAGQQQRR